MDGSHKIASLAEAAVTRASDKSPATDTSGLPEDVKRHFPYMQHCTLISRKPGSKMARAFYQTFEIFMKTMLKDFPDV